MTLRVLFSFAFLFCAIVVCVTGCGGAPNHAGNWVAVQPGDTVIAGDANEKPDPAVKRQIITKARFTAEIGDMDQLTRDLTSQVAQLGGYVAGFNEQRHEGDRRSGTWTIRLPTDRFESFVAWLDDNATVLGKEVATEDVSEEFVDLTARLENKKNTELRLAKVLEDRTGKLEDVLNVEREIDRVREEIERLEGRIRFLSDRVAMCTITLSVTTRVQYAVAQPPPFVTRLSETWWESLQSLRELGEGLVLCLVGLLPWLPIIAAILYFAFRGLRWLSRRLAQVTQGHVIQPPVVNQAS